MQRARVRQVLLAVCAITAAGCAPANHYLIHPRQSPATVHTSSHSVYRDELLVHLEVARPPGPGPFGVVIVHPEGGKMATDMRGVIWDLASHGFLAIAADYYRRIDGRYQWTLFPWRSIPDAEIILDLATASLDADPNCVAVIGFSQGGVFSLLLAGYAPSRVAGVVAYYPVTDFPRWFEQEQQGGNFLRRWVFGIIRGLFRRESGASSDEEFALMLRRASAYYVATDITAPVLLVHGDKDTTAPVEESQRMAARLAAEGKTVQLLVIPGAVHIFNFRQRAQAAAAWAATVEWLDRWVGPTCVRARPEPIVKAD